MIQARTVRSVSPVDSLELRVIEDQKAEQTPGVGGPTQRATKLCLRREPAGARDPSFGGRGRNAPLDANEYHTL